MAHTQIHCHITQPIENVLNKKTKYDMKHLLF